MHVFLTGNIQVGKSTIIRNFITRSGLCADGFMTYREHDDDGGRSLYLAPYSPDLQVAERHLVARDYGRRLIPDENMTIVFDTYAAEILNASGNRDIIVMDELGLLESKSLVFQKAVMRRLAGDIPVLGVIKPAQTEFLNAIRALPNVELREVTVNNRDKMRLIFGEV